MIPAASLRVLVEVKGVPEGNAQLRAFQGKLEEVSHEKATATLAADVHSRGFDEFAAKIDETRLKTKRPITQTVKVNYDKGTFSRAYQDLKKLKDVWGGGSGHGGGSSPIVSALTPFGAIPSVVAVAAPAIVDLTGALTALTGSLAEATAGAGALSIAGGGVASVGIAGIVSVAIPAVHSLKALTKAQDNYTKAVDTYGQHSTQAKTALKQLHGAEQLAGPAATALAKTLGDVGNRWKALTKPGQNDFLGLLNDALDRFQAKMPLLARSADSSVAALRKGFDQFQGQVTGKGFNDFIKTMTGTFAQVVPKITHGLADWAQILMRIAEAAAPSLERVVGLWTQWSDKLLASTSNSRSLRQGISHLTDQFLSWVHLLTSAGDLLIAIFGAGAGQGQRLVSDLTGKLKEWTDWINNHQAKTHAFFKRAADSTRELFKVLAGFIPTFMQISTAMRPISQAFLAITKALNSIKVGNVSALTALLGAYVGLRGIGKIAGPLAATMRVFGAGGVAGGVAGGTEAGAAGAAGAGAAAGSGLAGLGLAAAPFAIAGIGAYTLAQRKSVFDASAQTGSMVADAVASHFSSDLGPAIDKALREKKLGKATELIGQLRDQIGLAINAGASPAAVAALRAKLAGATKGTFSLQLDQTAFLTNLDQLRTGAIQKLGDIKAAFRQNQTAIAGLTKDGSQQAKNYTIENMNAEVAAIRAGIKAQTISRRQGLAEIRSIMAQEKQIQGTTDQQIIHSAKNLKFVYGQTLDSLNKATGSSLSQLQAQVYNALKKFAYSTGSNLILGKFKPGGGPTVPPSGQFHPSHGPIGKQSGGIVPGVGEGDSYPTAVPEGTFILNKKAVAAFGFQKGGLTPVMLEPGEKVFYPHEVKQHSLRSLEAMNNAVPRFAGGGSVSEPHLRGPSGEFKALGQGAIHLNYLAAQKFLQAHMPKGGGKGGPVPPGSVRNWLTEALKITHHYSASNLAALFGRTMQESSGNPKAINLTDSNAAAGHPSKGLLQTIDSTFNAYKIKGHGNIWNPIDNAIAAIRYMFDRYGHIVGPSGSGYAMGGLVGAAQRLAKGGSAKSKQSPLEAMVARMKQLAAWHIPYVLGGGHSGFSDHPSSLDCSSAVSDVLHAGGYLGSPETSGQLESFGRPGAGKLTIFANAGHTFLNALGRWWGTSVDDGGAGGLGFHPTPSAGYLAKFVQRHPVGVGGGVSGSTFHSAVPAHTGYGFKGGATNAGGTYAPGRGQVSTDKLTFGSLPTTLRACRKELDLRREQLQQYRASLHTVKDPATKQAIQTNINLLVHRIQALLRTQARLVAAKAKKTALGKIAARGTLPEFDSLISQREYAYNAADAFVQQVLALEPVNITQDYIDREGAAYGAELGTEASWRNTIIDAENAATARIADLQTQITNIQALKAKHPRAYNKRKYKIPALTTAIGALKGLYDAATNTGSYAEALVNVQGYYPGRDIVASLPSNPVARSYGGLIFDTQDQIYQLGLKTVSTPDNSAQVEALKQLLTQANQRLLVQSLHDAVFAGFGGPNQNYAGAFAKGGTIPAGMFGLAGEAGPEVIQGPARVFSGADSQAMLSSSSSDPDVRVHIHGDVVSTHPDPVQVLIGDKRIDAKIRQVTRDDAFRSRGMPAGVLRR